MTPDEHPTGRDAAHTATPDPTTSPTTTSSATSSPTTTGPATPGAATTGPVVAQLSEADLIALSRLAYMAPDLPESADLAAAEQAYEDLLSAAAGDLSVVDGLGRLQDHLYTAGLSEIHPLARMIQTRFAEAGITPTDAERARFLDLPDEDEDEDEWNVEGVVEALRQKAEAITPQEEAFARATFARVGEDYPQDMSPVDALTIAWCHEEATGQHYRALVAAASADPSHVSTLDDIESHRQALGLPDDAPLVARARTVARADAQAHTLTLGLPLNDTPTTTPTSMSTSTSRSATGRGAKSTGSAAAPSDDGAHSGWMVFDRATSEFVDLPADHPIHTQLQADIAAQDTAQTTDDRGAASATQIDQQWWNDRAHDTTDHGTSGHDASGHGVDHGTDHGVDAGADVGSDDDAGWSQ